jgi:uncharacterized iron-regulated membrane protein
MLKTALQIHKWVGLVVAIQVLFWVVGGLVMTVLPISWVRGENHAPPPVATRLIAIGEMKSPAELALGSAEVRSAELRATPRGPLWLVKTKSARHVFDAASGLPLSRLTPDEATGAAKLAYVGRGEPGQALFLQRPPQEAATTTPLYSVTFDDAVGTTLYLDPDTGETVKRRSNLWRFYDLFWRLHIMDWPAGENFNHPLIIAAAALTLFVTVTGVILLWLRLARDLRNLDNRRRRAQA